ncbi:MAG: GNAT family N-acetyltransferase [Firmicutes bacterium]|nr:GNAT family N-acetyltransferase [Bacillota bacterium]
MIRLVEAGDGAWKELCRNSAFGCRILTAAGCYPSAPFAAFWLQSDETGTPCAAVSRLEGEGTVCCGALPVQQRQELAAFVQSLGLRSVLAPAGILPQEQVQSSGAVLQLAQTAARREIPAQEPPSARELFALFSRCRGSGFDFSADAAAYVDLSHRLRHGFCRAVGIRGQDGTLCSAAMTVAESETEAVAGGVCTLPERRGSGLASAAVRSLCAALQNDGKKIFLLAGRELIPFYSRLGFLCCGEWEQCAPQIPTALF